jgi:hypothetical protein
MVVASFPSRLGACWLLFGLAASLVAPANAQISGANVVFDAPADASDASPADLYRMYQEHLRKQQAGLLRAVAGLRQLAADDRNEELECARSEMLESMEPATMAPFIARSEVHKWESIPADERSRWFARYLSEERFPTRLEVRRETIEGEKATLDVRGYFDGVEGDEPAWSSGTITLAREGGRWKVASESWNLDSAGNRTAREPADVGAACGSFELSGAVVRSAGTASVSQPRPDNHGGWRFSLHDEAYVVMLRNIPGALAVGSYPFAKEMPSVPEDWDWETPLDFPLHVVLAEREESGGLGRTWDDGIAGALSVEDVDGDSVSGRFDFTDGSVRVRGSFCNVAMPDGADVASVDDMRDAVAITGQVPAGLERPQRSNSRL